VVFCRNVLIYFDLETKVGVLDRIARIIQPDGYLVPGAVETVMGLTESFRPLPDRRGLYMAATPACLPVKPAPRLAAAMGGR